MLKKIVQKTVDLLLLLIVALLIIWFMISQPLFTVSKEIKCAKLINPKDLNQSVYEMVEKFDGRVYDDLKVLDATASYIYSKFSEQGAEVHYQNYELEGLLEEDKYQYKNVIANFKGREHCEDGVRIVGAHYDTFDGMAGANDNTSGVAGLLAMAKVLKMQPPRCDVQLVAYTLEEPPAFRTTRMGSYIHAKQLSEQGVKVKYLLVLETIGFYSSEPNSQNYPVPIMNWYYPKEANFVALVSNFANIFTVREVKSAMQSSGIHLPVYSINAPTFIPGVDFSDHRNYWEFDIPSVMVTDTAFYRSDNYHTENDTPDTLDYDRMAEVIEAVVRLVRE